METIAMMGAFLAIIVAAVIVWYVLYAIANMRLFAKAGKAGWKAWVPVLNTYTSYTLCWDGRIFWIWLLLAVVNYFVTANAGSSIILALVSSLTTVAATAISLLKATRMSKAFGHGYAFAVGLFFLEPIFTMILGFGSSMYQGIPDSARG